MSLLALGSTLVPAFPPVGQWPVRDSLTDHSGGTAPDSHRLPRSAVTYAHIFSQVKKRFTGLQNRALSPPSRHRR
ncbi:hypothetical protein GCM10017600_61930 [Streptosporangium carneum]|uniref:Uncharacterized protein n=1 Tax=Streptosporangium carneum TaxID=47481 RepID=A0A9W6I6Z3_9ACTN|nr:hypothetical protein GCM10017600_61930 [Streptosporangium carneum]